MSDQQNTTTPENTSDDGEIILFEETATLTQGDQSTDVGLRIASCSTERCDGVHIYVDVMVEGVTPGWISVARFNSDRLGTSLAMAAILADVVMGIMGKTYEERKEVAEASKAVFDQMQDRMIRHLHARNLIQEAGGSGQVIH